MADAYCDGCQRWWPIYNPADAPDRPPCPECDTLLEISDPSA